RIRCGKDASYHRLNSRFDAAALLPRSIGRGRNFFMEKDAPLNRRSRLTPDSIGSEITEQSTQSNLQESQGRLAAIVEKSPDFMVIVGLDMIVWFLKGAGQRIVGLNGMREVRATKRTDYFFPEDREFVEQIITPAVLKNGSWSGEIRFRHFKTGQGIP